MTHLLRRADSEVRPLRLNFYKKAKFANAFKWRLIEKGIARAAADEITQSLVLHLSRNPIPAATGISAAVPANGADRAKVYPLFKRGNQFYAHAAYAEAAACYEEALGLDPLHAEAHNNLGSALSHLGHYERAEECFRSAMRAKPSFSDPYGNLAVLLRQKSRLLDSETLLRRALKLRPTNVDARNNLGLTLVFLGRLRDAKACFTKVLKSTPRNVLALFGLGQIATVEGRFEEAEATFRRVLEIDPKMVNAWAALVLTRRMTLADGEWWSRAATLASTVIHPLEEANLRFAMGKYCDDVADFPQAFQNFKRGNDLLKTAAEHYDRKQRSQFIDELMRVYSAQSMSMIGAAGSSSAKPVFVVGMPRSGTSLVEQIIASHPAAYGAGELDFWGSLIAQATGTKMGMLDAPGKLKVAADYLRVLERVSRNASRVVDKAPTNSDLLGLIYSVFPNARVIYVDRNAIDTCLSCYFQQFLTGINFSLDLSDLVHYYREHRRIMAHWRAVLPPGFILDVSYESLIADQEVWSRKMLDFIGLEWYPGVLHFDQHKRQVATASAWQVRQKIYKSSVARWRNYEKFIGPLKALGK